MAELHGPWAVETKTLNTVYRSTYGTYSYGLREIGGPRFVHDNSASPLAVLQARL